MDRGHPGVDGIVIRRASLEEIVALRHVVLREGLPRESAIFLGDDDPKARHLGAFLNGRAVGCVTLHPSRWEQEPAWQLRGMAVADGQRGRGLGRRMLEVLEEGLRADSPVLQLWCNARVPAARFYEQNGWRIVSEPFEIPTAGPHVRMTKRVGE